MVNGCSRRKALLMIAGLLIVSLSLSSCDMLKQKFIRKKKGGEDDQSFVPVLEPEDYPTPANDPKMNYIQNYDLIKAWYKDLWSAIDDKSSARYIHYILTQVTNHIDQMKPLVDAPTREDLKRLGLYLNYYETSLDYPWQARDIARIESDLRYFDRFLRDHLRADKIKGHFITAMPAPAAPAKS